MRIRGNVRRLLESVRKKPDEVNRGRGVFAQTNSDGRGHEGDGGEKQERHGGKGLKEHTGKYSRTDGELW